MHHSDKRHKMVRWYNPALLARTGIRAAISTAVGQVADNREVRAGLYREPPLFDHSKDVKAGEDFWFDFVADLGDGWQATYAVACAINAKSLPLAKGVAPRANVVIMGGDEVYPEPSIEAYCERTVAPWNASCVDQEPFNTDLYAIPGNHDWYDGLHAFSDVFCRNGRSYPGFSGIDFDCHTTRQLHSYFALKLKKGWWLCAIDVQLNGRIDAAQYDFFENVSKKMGKDERIILCAPTPSWVREKTGYTGASKLLASMGELFTSHGAELRIVLAGDVHHYSRYASQDEKLHLITSGGGGAFMHPTHILPQTASIEWTKKQSQEFNAETCYPLHHVSKRLSYGNLGFFFKNIDFSLALGAIYMLLAWFLETRQASGGVSLRQMFQKMVAGHTSVADTLGRFFETIPKSPEFTILLTIFTVAFIAFTITPNRAGRITFGLIHSFAHLVGLVTAYCVAAQLVSMLPGGLQTGLTGFSIFLFTLFLIGSVLGGFIVGGFLLFSLNVLGWQWTNAFSALRIANYKNFLRLKIAADGTLTVYAFGIDDVADEQAKARLVDELTIKK